MGDARFGKFYRRVRDAADRVSAIDALSDDEVISALAAAVGKEDALLVNVLATEASNRAARAQLASDVTDSLGEGIIAVDLEGHVTFLNPRAEELLGWSRDELRGQLIQEIVCAPRADGASALPPHDLFRVAESGVPQRAEDVFRHKKGDAVAVSYTAAALEDEDTGKVVGVAVVFRPILDNARAEAVLATRKAAEPRASDPP